MEGMEPIGFVRLSSQNMLRAQCLTEFKWTKTGAIAGSGAQEKTKPAGRAHSFSPRLTAASPLWQRMAARQ